MNKITFWLLVIIIAVNIFIYSVIYNYLYLSPEKVNFLSVGQGDAELIQSQTGNILIDAGPDDSIISQLDKCLPFYNRTIDVFILSHPNKDHYAGLFPILLRYKVRAIVVNNVVFPSITYQNLLQQITDRKIPLVKGVKGVVIRGKDSLAKLFILYPDALGKQGENVNDLSSIDVWQTPIQDFLFTGDAGFAEERKIIPVISSFPFSPHRVLKVAHHGSRYATSKNFLDSFSPQVAVIEVGKNHYGHPSLETLQRLTQASVSVFRTDLDGLIRFKIR